MKHYSELGINEQLNLASTNKDKFFVYAKNRLHSLNESASYNVNVAGLFHEGLLESSVDAFLERFWQNHKGTYTSLIESFNKLTESSDEQHTRFKSITEAYRKEVEKNPYYPANQMLLKEAVEISKVDTIFYLLNEGSKIANVLDVCKNFDGKLYENNAAEQASLEIKDDPNYVLGLAESISRAIQYTLAQKGTLSEALQNKTQKFLESLNNIYSIYKEGMELVKTQEYQTSEIFKMFLTDRANGYFYTVDNLQKTLKDPASFAQLCMYYFQNWVENHAQRLCYKFPSSTLTRLRDLITYYDAAHATLRMDDKIPPEYYGFDKMYKMLDLLFSVSQMLRMDLRNLVCKYVTIVRPLIDSYRTDFLRSPMRTGY